MGRHERSARALAALRRHGVTLLGAVMIAVGGIWAAVAWAATAVEINGLDDPDPVELSTLTADVPEDEPVGYSLKSVLSAAGVGSSEWARVVIGSIEVTREEYPDFKNEPPAFYITKDQQEVTFVRPRKKKDGRQETTSGDLEVDYLVPLEVASDPDFDKAKAGDTVKFTADVPGPNEGFSFEWDANGTIGDQRQFEYTLPESGEVVVHVEATRGVQTLAEATLSTELKEPDDDDGDDGSGDDTGGTDTGGYDTGGYDTGGYDTGPSYTPNFSNPGDTGGSGTPKVPDAPKQPDPNEEPTIETEAGITVDGELLSVPLTPPGGESAPSSPESQEAEAQELVDEAKEVSAPGALIAGGIIVGLLGLGAGREVENKRPPRFLRRLDLSGLRRLSPPWK